MSNTENPSTENPAVEQDDEGEDSSGLKVRTSLKAGSDLAALGLVGPRGPIRNESYVATSSYITSPQISSSLTFRPTL